MYYGLSSSFPAAVQFVLHVCMCAYERNCAQKSLPGFACITELPAPVPFIACIEQFLIT
jgi:hypothetical protein